VRFLIFVFLSVEDLRNHRFLILLHSTKCPNISKLAVVTSSQNWGLMLYTKQNKRKTKWALKRNQWN